MEDSYWEKKELINDAFEAGKIDYQQYLEMNRKIIKKYFAMGKCNAHKKDFTGAEDMGMDEISTGRGSPAEINNRQKKLRLV